MHRAVQLKYYDLLSQKLLETINKSLSDILGINAF